MEENMADTEQVSRTGILAEVMRRIADAVQPHDGFATRKSVRKARHHPGGSLDADVLRDIGARREVQDYTASAVASAGSARRLHRIAEAARWTPHGYTKGPQY
jgi:hypothetical protein